MGLIRQPALDDDGDLGVSMGRDDSGLLECSVAITYTLWRNPGDRSDPVNLARLDDATRALVERPTPRPPWIAERLESLRYPKLWEAVRTTWTREAPDATWLADQLLQHLDHILMSQYMSEDVSSIVRGDPPPERPHAVNHDATVQVDGVETPAVEVDSAAHRYAIGVRLSPTTVVTAVLPRDELRYIDIAFERRPTTSSE